MCLLRCNSIADWLHSTGWREIGSLLSDTGGGAPLLGPSGSTEQVPHRCRRLPPPPSPPPPPLRPTIWPMDNYNDFFNTVHTAVWNGIQTRPLSQLTSITLLRDIGHLRSPAPISTLAPKLSSKLKIWKKNFIEKTLNHVVSIVRGVTYHFVMQSQSCYLKVTGTCHFTYQLRWVTQNHASNKASE